MKKTGLVIAGAAGVILLAYGILMQQLTKLVLTGGSGGQAAASVSIIGGADGPTSIFIAGKIGSDFSVPAIFLGMLLIIGVILLVIKSRKNK